MEATVLIRTASGSMHHYRPLTSSSDHDSFLFFGSASSPRSTITVHFDRRSSSSSASPPESCSHSAPLRRSRSDACAAIRSARWSESTRILKTENEDKEDLLVTLDSAGSSRIGTAGSTKRFFLDTSSTSDKAASARGAVVEEEVEFSGSGGAGRGRKIGGGGRGNGSSSGGGSAGGEMGAYYKKMLSADPENPLFLRNYGKFLQEVEGDVEGAEECYGRALLASPGDGEVLSLYGNLMWEAHRDEKRAEDYYQRAVQASPDDSYVLGSYAHFLWDAEEVEEEISTATASSSSMSSSNGVMVKAF